MSDMQNDATPVKASSQSDCAIDSVREVVRRLTAEDGCPWDKTQTPESLTEYVIEESHELVSAIRSGTDEDVCEELGDVAFLLLFIAHLYEKKGSFTLRDVFEKTLPR